MSCIHSHTPTISPPLSWASALDLQTVFALESRVGWTRACSRMNERDTGVCGMLQLCRGIRHSPGWLCVLVPTRYTCGVRRGVCLFRYHARVICTLFRLHCYYRSTRTVPLCYYISWYCNQPSDWKMLITISKLLHIFTSRTHLSCLWCLVVHSSNGKLFMKDTSSVLAILWFVSDCFALSAEHNILWRCAFWKGRSKEREITE